MCSDLVEPENLVSTKVLVKVLVGEEVEEGRLDMERKVSRSRFQS